MEAVRETVLNALAHRDWTRATDIEITKYSDRLEVISPGALPNSMTIDKMKAGRRTPRNPVIIEVLRDYGYVDARGMGVPTKIIPLTRQYTGEDPVFEATDDFVKTVINTRKFYNNGLECPQTAQRPHPDSAFKRLRDPENMFQGRLLELIRANPKITYDQLAAQTGRSRKMVKRHLQSLKASGFLRRTGSAKGGRWEAIEA
jgi:ATP-dependent DNA helicase RecG